MFRKSIVLHYSSISYQHSQYAVGKRAQAHFFITFLNLNTCLNKVKDIIRNMNLEGYCTKRRKFQFKASTTAAIEIVISNPCCGMIGLDGSKKVSWFLILKDITFSQLTFISQIFRSDVDFFVKKRLSQGEQECLQSDDFYPPRFDMFFASFQENATLSDGKIAFRGATSDIEFNIHLDLSHPRTRAVASHAPSKLLTHKSKQYYLPTFYRHKRHRFTDGGASSRYVCTAMYLYEIL